jgi:phosphotransferase system HPr (HPr) family protein
LHKEEITIQHAVGLHARPAAVFVRLAASFPATIQIRKVGEQGRSANAKSILSVLGLGVNQGDRVEIEADGERAAEALQALVDLIRANFGESPG